MAALSARATWLKVFRHSCQNTTVNKDVLSKKKYAALHIVNERKESLKHRIKMTLKVNNILMMIKILFNLRN